MTDPHRRFRRLVALQAGGCWILVLLAAIWAWRVPVAADPLPAAPRSVQTPAAPAQTAAIDPAAWNITLWRPFTDEAPPTAAATAPLALKLVSILRQGDGLTAALDPGDNAGLIYVKAGDVGNGFAVVRVEADAVVLRINGQQRRLGLGP